MTILEKHGFGYCLIVSNYNSKKLLIIDFFKVTISKIMFLAFPVFVYAAE